MGRGMVTVKGLARLKKEVARNYHLYLLLVLPLLYYIIFKYGPMYGIIIAFRKYNPGGSLFGGAWVGLKYFELFIYDSTFWNVFKNTVLLSIFNLLVGFPIPIIFALLLNEVHHKVFKRIVQTTSYIPKFFSMVVVVGMLNQLLSPSTGVVNLILNRFGLESIHFLNEPNWFRPVYILSDLWQFMGWNSILYVAALTNIDIQLYEAAYMDGANRWRQTIHVTIPGIMPTITITSILAVGYVMSVGFEKVFLLYNPVTYSTADVIDTFVYRMGIVNNNYSYSTAVGLFQSVIGLFLIWGANKFAGKFSETSLW